MLPHLRTSYNAMEISIIGLWSDINILSNGRKSHTHANFFIIVQCIVDLPGGN